MISVAELASSDHDHAGDDWRQAAVADRLGFHERVDAKASAPERLKKCADSAREHGKRLVEIVDRQRVFVEVGTPNVERSERQCTRLIEIAATAQPKRMCVRKHEGCTKLQNATAKYQDLMDRILAIHPSDLPGKSDLPIDEDDASRDQKGIGKPRQFRAL